MARIGWVLMAFKAWKAWGTYSYGKSSIFHESMCSVHKNIPHAAEILEKRHHCKLYVISTIVCSNARMWEAGVDCFMKRWSWYGIYGQWSLAAVVRVSDHMVDGVSSSVERKNGHDYICTLMWKLETIRFALMNSSYFESQHHQAAS